MFGLYFIDSYPLADFLEISQLVIAPPLILFPNYAEEEHVILGSKPPEPKARSCAIT